MEYLEAKKEAKKKGINTHGMKKDQVIKAALGELDSESNNEAAVAKAARMERRARRGGALLGKDESRLNRPEYLRKGYHRRWFKDEGGRLKHAYDSDYDYVEDAKGNKITHRSGTNRDGSLRTMYLMEKHIDWYNEDQQKKNKRNMEKEKILKEGNIPTEEYSNAAQNIQMYQPSDGLKINNEIIKN